MLVWHEGFTDWMKAGAVAELKAQTSRPADQMLLAGEVLLALVPIASVAPAITLAHQKGRASLPAPDVGRCRIYQASRTATIS